MSSKLQNIKDQSSKIVHISAGFAGAAGAIPIPFSDSFAIAPIQANMINQISSKFKVDCEKSKLNLIITGIFGITIFAYAGRAVVGGALKFVPFLGSAVCTTTAVGITELIGQAYIQTLSCYYNEKTDRTELPLNFEKLFSDFKNYFFKLKKDN